MILKSKHFNFSLFGGPGDVRAPDVVEARKHVADYWHKLIRYHPKDDENLIGLPNPYIVPAFEEGHEFDFNELYYWDSYFNIQGLLDEEHKELVMGMLDDLIVLFKRFGIIPNASRTYLTGRSQPPFLTSFIFDVYDAYNLDVDWLKEKILVAEDEYRFVWMGKVKPNARQVYHGLSRYFDVNYLNDLAEAESGWDMTTRFNRKCLSYLPVDLNSLLYKYETDFVRFYKIIKDQKKSVHWQVNANYRKKTMDNLMWSNLKGSYFDYNFIKGKRGTVNSLATFYPMWAGMATQEQAAQLVKALRRFEQRGGLSTTDTQQLNVFMPGTLPTQWAYPNGWAPLEYIVIKGLQRYGYYSDAKRIAMKWLRTNLDWYNHHKVFMEKYNVVSPDKPPLKGLYPSQNGFGWTNSIFERLCQEYVDVNPNNPVVN
jgi:alpha,alpha-trehalase